MVGCPLFPRVAFIEVTSKVISGSPCARYHELKHSDRYTLSQSMRAKPAPGIATKMLAPADTFDGHTTSCTSNENLRTLSARLNRSISNAPTYLLQKLQNILPSTAELIVELFTTRNLPNSSSSM